MKNKTWNIWICGQANYGPTGPWTFGCAVVAETENDAILTAINRFGSDKLFKVYEGL